MAALTTNRDTRQFGRTPVVDNLSIPLAAAAHAFAGGIACVNAAGYGVPGSASSTLKVVGRFEEEVDNSAGVAGALSANVKRGTFKWANSATTDAITIADIGRDCYVVDDQTVARTSSNGTRPVAGRVVQVDTDGVWVETAPIQGNGKPIDLFLVAAGDLTSSQYLGVYVDSNGAAAVAGAGVFAIGVLQNAPAAAAIAVVRVSGVTPMIAGGVVAVGSRVACDAAGKSKVAVAASVNTSDAGAAADAVVGSNVVGIALTVGAADTAHQVLLTHSGAIPTTAA